MPSTETSVAWTKFTHRADLYARRVLNDAGAGVQLVAGPLVRAACRRHLTMRSMGAQPEGHSRGYWFDEDAANNAIAFFETVLKLPDTQDEHGDPKPFLLEPWQAFIVGSLFGWKKADGYRLYRDAYLEIAKGNGKTPLSAGIGLYGLVVDNELAAEIYSASVTRDQARYLWNDAARMVECSPELAALVRLSVGNLACPETFGFFRTCSSEHRGLDGKRAHMALIDELHEHPSGMVANKIRANAKGRRQPLFVETTNSGFDRTSICWEHHEHSRRVVEGVVEDDHWFAYVCALDEGDDPLTDPSCWIKTNPNLGVSIREDYLQRQVDNARNLPGETNTVLRLNFCVWTQAITRFFDVGKWQACQPAVPDHELFGRCFAGLDLGQSDDLSAFVRIWLLDDGRVGLRARFWLPEAAVTKYPDRPYHEWIRDGWLEVTDGEIADYGRIEAAVLEDCRQSGVLELAYDKRFAAQLAQNLMGAGITVVDTAQGFALNEAIKRTAEWSVNGTLCHGHNPILTWMVANAVARYGRNGEVRLDKAAAKEKIDGVMALVMAVSRALAYVARPTPSIVWV